jgi:hypothetical protein
MSGSQCECINFMCRILQYSEVIDEVVSDKLTVPVGTLMGVHI